MARPPTVDIDEFTLVLSLKDADIGCDWIPKCEEFIAEFLKRSQLEILFDKMTPRYTGLPEGYISGLSYDTKPWYLAIAWHEGQPRMGVCVRFSAHAWSAYRQHYSVRYGHIDLATFLAQIKSYVYNVHFTRIDLVADYWDYPDPDNIPNKYLKPDTIYRNMHEGKYAVKTYKGTQSIQRTSAIDRDGEYQTVYLGSKKGAFFMRIYDKRMEQITTKGYRFDDAVNCRSWVRFEMVVRHNGAKVITEQLATIQNPQELHALIAKHITDKFQFIDTQTDTALEFTEDLLSIATGATVAPIKSASTRNTELAQAVSYIKQSSGLYSLLYKVWKIFGQKAVHKLMLHFEIDFFLDAHSPRKFKDAKNWVNRYYDTYSRSGLQIEDIYMGRTPDNSTAPTEADQSNDNATQNTTTDADHATTISATTNADHAATPDTTTNATQIENNK